jgi:DNA-binding MarR family transcriptional regulator
LLLFSKRNPPFTPSQIANHARIVESRLQASSAFVFLRLSASDRKRLIQRQVPFIVPGQQTYLPTALIDLREHAKSSARNLDRSADLLSAPAQALLLFELQKKPESAAWPLHRWADTLGYSRMTLTRVVRELVSSGLCQAPAKGREVLVQLRHHGAALWREALPLFDSPIKDRRWCQVMKGADLPILEAGPTALSRFSLLAAGRTKVAALSSHAYRNAVRGGKVVPLTDGDEADSLIERWRYDPARISPDGRTVDRLSLYLSLAKDPDERVQAALSQMLQEIAW